jgi:hypothetical protein
MTTFLLDLWQDLRAKRLWPVAVALVAATVAVPVVVFKPASTAPPATGAAAASNRDKLPSVTLDASSVAGSHLDVFKEKNPFDVLSDANTTTASAANTAAGNPAAGSSAASGGGAGAGSASGSGATGGGSPPPASSSGTGGGSAPNGPDGKPLKPGVHYFTYTADVRFGPRSAIKTYKGVNTLDVLPDGSNPIVAFMGVKHAKTALFFISDPAFRVDGEGKCDPTPDNCMFLTLGTDSGHDEATLSAHNGQVEYDLQLTGLHVKNLDPSAAVGNTTPQKSSRTRRARTRATLLSAPLLGVTKR